MKAYDYWEAEIPGLHTKLPEQDATERVASQFVRSETSVKPVVLLPQDSKAPGATEMDDSNRVETTSFFTHTFGKDSDNPIIAQAPFAETVETIGGGCSEDSQKEVCEEKKDAFDLFQEEPHPLLGLLERETQKISEKAQAKLRWLSQRTQKKHLKGFVN